MKFRKLEPGELIDPSIYCGKNGIKVKNIERNSFFYPEQKDYLFKVGYANGLFCLVDINGHAYRNADYDLQVIIESPEPSDNKILNELLGKAHVAIWELQTRVWELEKAAAEPVEKDWSEVLDRLAKCADQNQGHYSFRMEALQILQQSDKPKVDPVTGKMWVNVFDKPYEDREHKNRWDADSSAHFLEKSGFKRIACKEIQFSYVKGEGL